MADEKQQIHEEVQDGTEAADRPERAQLGDALLRLAVTAFALGLIVRLTVKDSIALFDVFYHFLPPVVLAALAALCAGMLLKRRRFRTGIAVGIVMLECLVWWGTESWAHRSRDRLGRFEPVRIMFWDVDGRHGSWESMLAKVQGAGPDFVALAEVRGGDREARRRLTQLAEGYGVGHPLDNMAYLTRLPVRGLRTLEPALGSTITRLELRLTGGDLIALYVVDMNNDPFTSRKQVLDTLVVMLWDDRDIPTILVGDLNLPADSVQLDALRRITIARHGLKNAAEEVGEGYLPTWPVPVPFMQRDQVWVNGRVHPLATKTEWVWRGSHLPVVLDFEILPPPGKGTIFEWQTQREKE